MANILERIFGKPETRASLEDPTVPISHANILQVLGFGAISKTGIRVTTKNALEVPAVWAAVNFLSGTIAGLPLHVYTKSRNGPKKKTGKIAGLLHDAVNDDTSSFAWRKYIFDQVFTGGRGLTYIERDARGNPINLFPMDPKTTKCEREGNQRFYTTPGAGRKSKRLRYEAKDVIDIPFMLDTDQLTHVSPIAKHAETIGLAIASVEYGARIFRNGGIPPLVIEGPFQTDKAMQRASADLVKAMVGANEQGRPAIALPAGHTAKTLGLDPEKMQLIAVQRWCLEQIARIYSIPPNFLQDLTASGGKSDSEQQDIHLAKHTVKRWLEQAEQEMNLKLFGRNSSTYCEFSLDGLQRGDFASRMAGSAQAISVGALMPNEARARENLPPVEGGNKAYIQGAMMPLDGQQNASLGDTKTGSAPAMKE